MNESPQQPWIDVNEIKRAVSIDQVLAHYGLLDKLQRRGNSLQGLSPFRKETRPSFFVSLEKGAWNDYPRPTVEGKEVPGNVVGLVMAIENCGFRDALVKLHDMAGLASVPSPSTARAVSRSEHAPSSPMTAPTAMVAPAPPPPPGASAIAAVTAPTSAKVDEVLAGQPAVNEAFGKELKGLRYDVPFLEQRGLSADRARFWGVGYCSRGLMKGRIIVPIRNRAGEIVAYVGRSLKDDDPEGKWRFPKGFRKSLELFGADRLARDAETREAVVKHGLIVVEGCFDAIALVEKGFKNTVSTLGSDVSAQQCALLVDETINPSRKVTIFFDHDEAGKTGRKKLCADLVYRGFVRYVEFDRVAMGERTDPDQLGRPELIELLK